MRRGLAAAFVGVSATHVHAPSVPVDPTSPGPAAPTPDAATPDGPATTPPVPAPTTITPPGMTDPSPTPQLPSTRVRPPLSASRLLGEGAAGAALGFVGLALGAYAGVALECASSCHGELPGLGGGLLGAYLGGSLGVSLGVYAVGVAGDHDGSYVTTLGGALLGPLVGGLGATLIEKTKSTSSDHAADTLAAMVFVGGWLGTTMVFFNETRSAPAPAVIGAAVTYDRRRASLGMPVVVHAERASYLTLAAGRF